MKIVLLIPKMHAGAELALNKILLHKDLNIVGLVRSDITIFTRRYWNYIIYGIKKSGLFYAAMVGLLAYIHLVAILFARLFRFRKKRKWFTVDELVTKHHIPIHDTQDINSESSIAAIKAWEPDVMVSMFFDQILKQPVIDIPKQATLNMHPGILPKYRGLWPEFWKLLNDEKNAGVTIHHIIEKIDAGNVIAQTQFPIRKTDSKFTLALRSAQRGAKLMITTLKKLKAGKKLEPIKIEGDQPTYHSFPKKEHFDKFYSKGKSLINFFKVWRIFRKLS